MSGYRSISPNITNTTPSGQLRTELLNSFARLDGTLSLAPFRVATQNGPAGNSGSSETALMSTTIEQGTMTLIGQSLLIFAFGTTAANANNKTLKLVLGSTTLFTSGAIALNDKDWTLQAEVVFNGGAAQMSFGQFVSNGAAAVTDVNTGTESWASNLVLKLTGTGTSSADISVNHWKVLLVK